MAKSRYLWTQCALNIGELVRKKKPNQLWLSPFLNCFYVAENPFKEVLLRSSGHILIFL